MPDFPYRFGRSHAVHPIGYRAVATYAPAIPDAPATFDHTHGFNRFRMLGNGPDSTLTVHGGQPVGDCAFVGTVNVGVVDAAETGEDYAWPTTDEVVSDYLRYDRGRDAGANLSQLLAVWRKVGLPWSKPILGYAALDFRTVGAFWAGVNAFGNGYIGIAVTEAMQVQTSRREPWDLTGTELDYRVVGGHCVVVISRTSTGGEVATWGMRQAFTERWFRAYVEEAHVVITPQQAAAKGNGYGLDEDRLVHDLNRLSA